MILYETVILQIRSAQYIRWTHKWDDRVSPSICMFYLLNLLTNFDEACTNICQENWILSIEV
jgi:hypothetical protein